MARNRDMKYAYLTDKHIWTHGQQVYITDTLVDSEAMTLSNSIVSAMKDISSPDLWKHQFLQRVNYVYKQYGCIFR